MRMETRCRRWQMGIDNSIFMDAVEVGNLHWLFDYFDILWGRNVESLQRWWRENRKQTVSMALATVEQGEGIFAPDQSISIEQLVILCIQTNILESNSIHPSPSTSCTVATEPRAINTAVKFLHKTWCAPRQMLAIDLNVSDKLR